MRYHQLRAFSDEFEKIAVDSPPPPPPKWLSVNPDKYRELASSIQGMPLGEAVDTLGALHAEVQQAKRKGALEDVSSVIQKHSPSYLELVDKVKGNLKGSEEVGAYPWSSRAAFITGQGHAITNAMAEIRKKELPATVATIGGLIGGSLLINHLVKKYREDEQERANQRRSE